MPVSSTENDFFVIVEIFATRTSRCLLSADAGTFVTIILSASCWSNLDSAMIDNFL